MLRERTETSCAERQRAITTRPSVLPATENASSRPEAMWVAEIRIASTGGGRGPLRAADHLIHIKRGRLVGLAGVAQSGEEQADHSVPPRGQAAGRPLGTQPSSAAVARTRSRVAAEKPLPSVMTLNTVAVDTPLRFATS